MNQKFLKIFIFVIILCFYASFLLVKIGLSASDNDAGLYITDGKVIWQTQKVFRQNIYSYTVPDYSVYDHHWLSSVVFYLTNEFFGFKGLTILKTLILLSAFAILFGAALKKADFWLVAAASLPTILILAQRPRIRPEMFSYLFIALFLYLLFYQEKHPESKRIFWLIPLQLLWINFHLFFFVGIALVGGLLFEKIIFHTPKIFEEKFWKPKLSYLWRDPIVKKLLLILPMLVIVVFVNPNGLEGVLAPIKTHSYASFMVSENQPFFNFKASIFTWGIFNSAFVPMVFVFLVSLIFGFWKKPLDSAGSTILTTSRGRQWPIFFLFAVIGSAGAGLIQVRLVTLFALMFLPAVSSNFNGAFLKMNEWLKRKWPKPATVTGYVLAFSIAVAFPVKAYQMNAGSASRGYTTDWGVGLSRYSNDAGKFFKEHNLKGPIFNDYDIGGYIIYHLFPGEKVFVDNNGADSYPASFFEDIFMPALASDEKWRETEKKYELNAIFISMRDGSPSIGGFLWNRLHDQSWALVYVDSYAIIFLKNAKENQKIINKFQITPENVKDKVSSMLESSVVFDRIVAGRLLYLIGREDLSTSVFKKVVAQYPKNGWAWLYMGAVKSMSNNPQELISAIIFLENAVNMGEKTSEGYTWLGLAYFKFGQFEKAESAFQKALYFDPGRQDTTNYLRQLQTYLEQ